MTTHSTTVTESETGDVQTVCTCGWAGRVYPYTLSSIDQNLADAHDDGTNHIRAVRFHG